METTKLYVEYIVVGMETLAIIFLVIFIIIGNAFLPIIKYCIKNIVPSIIMLGWCYILGLIVDRIADIIYDKRKMHIKEKYPIVAETSIIVWEHFKQDSAAPEAVPPAPCREYCFPPYDGFFSFAIVRQLFHFSFILTGNPHRNVTDILHFDKITS